MFLFYGYYITSISITKCTGKIVLLIMFLVILKPGIIVSLSCRRPNKSFGQSRAPYFLWGFFVIICTKKKKTDTISYYVLLL